MKNIFKKRTFFDYRNQNEKYAKKHTTEGYVLIRRNNQWLVYLKKSDKLNISGLVIAPETVYLYNIYKPYNIIDAIKKILW